MAFAVNVSHGDNAPSVNDTDRCLAQASKVAVLGAGGGIGQPLSLLLKLNPRVTELALYDVRGAPGMSSPLSVCLVEQALT